MKINGYIKATLMVTAMAAALAGTVGASAADPTQGRINQRVAAQNNQEYFRCAKFSLAVYNACLEQAGNQSPKIRSCRSHYQGNLGRCRAASQ